MPKNALPIALLLIASLALLVGAAEDARGGHPPSLAPAADNPIRGNEPRPARHPDRADAASGDESLARTITALAWPLIGESTRFGYLLQAGTEDGPSLLQPRVADATPGRKPPRGVHRVTILRLDRESWSLEVESTWRNVLLLRQASQTILAIPQERDMDIPAGEPETPAGRSPRGGVAFVGGGELPRGSDTLAAAGLCGRLITPETSLHPFLAILGPTTLEAGLRRLVLPRLQPLPAGEGPAGWHSWALPGGGVVRVPTNGQPLLSLTLASDSRGLAGLHSFSLEALPAGATDSRMWPSSPDGPAQSMISAPSAITLPENLRRIEVSRVDLEKMIFRGLARAFSVKFPGPPVLNRPEPRTVPHGDLQRPDGQVLVRLTGTPSQIGTAHGQLLGAEIRRTIDSTIYLVGLVATIEKGKWFLDELEDAWKRLSPHIPARHREELDAVAAACPGITVRETRLSSIFPEYFHCSGFAVFGRASADGVLYHGRVLDYMTEIGLQQCAVAFVVKPSGFKAFLNAGFSGFQGSVSGMNEAGISLGEMGGGGRYLWDGAPMATLMRRALEECDSLAQVKQLWASAPRTCEYYYVFADGKVPTAVGVKATPQAIEFLDPGQAHPLLGEGIADTVVMSAGKRLSQLRQRLMAGHGTFTASSSLRLMDRPVAMRSNLHNCLFVPARGEAFIANADDRRPAADCPYTRYDLRLLLKDLPR